MIACPGSWKNFEDIEEHLSLPEVQQILDSFREIEHNKHKFMAALKGVDLDKESDETDVTFEKVKMRAMAKASGLSEEVYEFNAIGIAVEEFEEVEADQP